MSDRLVVEVRETLGRAVLWLSGRLSPQTSPTIHEATVKCLLGTGCVMIDVSRLRTPQAAFLSVFPAALTAAGGWPSARLVLFGASTDLRSMLVSSRITATVPLAADLASAMAMLEQRPSELRRQRDLSPHDTAPSAARLFVREACELWLVSPAVREVAELVSSELVSNAVEHAHSSSELTLTVTASALRVSVRDFRPGPIPRTRPIDIDSFRGRGLHLVAALAQTWGVEPHSDGKTIWASLPLEPA
ncbi:MAG TPA: ATP-binding protein [Pseudonocardiaceae bacterium]|nr:ATP-binding protein [Pseudonocardiaceae bacterium]